MRFELDQYINLRPVRLFPGVETPLKDKGPADLDFTVIRENTEGIYTGAGGFFSNFTDLADQFVGLININTGVRVG